MYELKTVEPKTLAPKIPADTGRRLLTTPPTHTSVEKSQQRLMVGALVLLLAALVLLLYHDRDFWFPETQEAQDQGEDQPAPSVAATNSATQPAARNAAPAITKKPHATNPPIKEAAKEAVPTAQPSAPVNATAERTVLPPLEVEVIAGDSHRKVAAGTNSVRVDLQPGTAPQAASESANAAPNTPAGVTQNAAERVQMATDASAIVSHSVRPGYPLLARQMKVQGSVILQALIGRDGVIQNLHVLSGPPILASAAEEAVKQWRFKPHYLGSEPVETQAKITVNFTISTN